MSASPGRRSVFSIPPSSFPYHSCPYCEDIRAELNLIPSEALKPLAIMGTETEHSDQESQELAEHIAKEE